MESKLIYIFIGLVILIPLGLLHGQMPGYRLSQVCLYNSPNDLWYEYAYNYYYSNPASALTDSIVYAYYIDGNVSYFSTSVSLRNADQNIVENYFYHGYSHPGDIIDKGIAQYDDTGRLCNIKYYMPYNGNLIPTGQRKFFIYDVNGDLDSLYWHDFFAINSCAYHIDAVNCDIQGRICEEYIKMSWDSLYWYPETRVITTYHNSDTMTGSQYIDKISKTMDYCCYDDFYSSHFGAGKILDKTYQTFNNNEWISYLGQTYTYDATGRRIDFICRRLDNDLRYLFKYEFFYNTEGNVSEIAYQSWNTDLNDWNSVSDYRIYTWEQYTGNEDVINPSLHMDLLIYPNPFCNDVAISLQSKSNTLVNMAVYNIKGQLIKSLGKSRNTSITWDGKDNQGKSVSNGIYFIKATQDGQSVSKKIIRIN